VSAPLGRNDQVLSILHLLLDRYLPLVRPKRIKNFVLCVSPQYFKTLLPSRVNRQATSPVRFALEAENNAGLPHRRTPARVYDTLPAWCEVNRYRGIRANQKVLATGQAKGRC
jgi:hypothetical protein